ncbi:hypothetical protein Hanom_Chr09g00805631 [Helianthus anomalus]
MRWCVSEENDHRHMQGHIIYQSIWHIRKQEPNMSCNMLRWSMSSIKQRPTWRIIRWVVLFNFFIYLYRVIRHV